MANTLRPTPKVVSGATWATIVTLALNSITPDMLAALGKWEPLVSAGIAILSYALGAYLKEDHTSPANTGDAADPATVVDEIAQRLAASPEAPATANTPK